MSLLFFVADAASVRRVHIRIENVPIRDLRGDELAAAQSASRPGHDKSIEDIFDPLGVGAGEEFGEVVGRERLGGGREMLADGMDLVGE